MKRSVDDENRSASWLNPPRWLSSDNGSFPMPSRGVEEPSDLTEIDKMLAQEVHNLSLQERNRVYEEIHGVAEPLKEEPDFVAQRFSEFKSHLSTIRHKSAYDLALHQSPEYVNNRNFHLMFLRSTEFDAHQAAQKLVNHFDFKMELFGQEKLAKDITYVDLNENDRECLKSGWIQILPATDRIGRPIVFVRPEMTMAAHAFDEKSMV
jgi:hypothetical protein